LRTDEEPKAGTRDATRPRIHLVHRDGDPVVTDTLVLTIAVTVVIGGLAVLFARPWG
jgi:hypothetical protein